MDHSYQDLIQLFADTFYADFNTRLVRGQSEPVYLPANEQNDFHQIVFAHGYFSSALHEVAHWCIAGEQRRTQIDYGYWYCEDGRDLSQQLAFESVEILPQAIEWAFSIACNKSFRVSSDNLNGAQTDICGFERSVQQKALFMLERGFPPRAKRFIQVLHQFYRTPMLSGSDFQFAILNKDKQ